MKLNTKRIVNVLVVLLLCTVSASATLTPVKAHTPAWNIPTYAFISVSPNPVGVGQQAYIYMWLDKTIDGANVFNDVRFHDYELTITAPNGEKTVKTWDVVSDTTSNQGYAYTPEQTGTYTLNFTFPGQTYDFNITPPSQYFGDTYQSSSASTTFTVQSTPIPTIPAAPLPTMYWTRPIYGENPNWYTLGSNWLGSGTTGYGSSTNSAGMGASVFPGDAVGSQTSHIMWTKPLQFGGIVGGNDFQIAGDSYFEGSAYLNRFQNPIIIAGMLYYTEPVGASGVAAGPTDCVNLQTGQLVWSKTSIPALSFGYVYDFQSPNEHGVYPPLLIAAFGGAQLFGPPLPLTWEAFDAYTGDFLFNLTNVPVGITIQTLTSGPPTSALGPNGEQLIYTLTNVGTPAAPQYYLAEWNSSRAFLSKVPGPTGLISGTVNGNVPSNYDWNISLSSLNTPTSNPYILDSISGNMLICLNGNYPTLGYFLGGAPSSSPYTYFAVNLNASRGAIGKILWSTVVQPPPGNITVLFAGADPSANGGAGVFAEFYRETMTYVGFSMATGAKLWGPTSGEVALNYYGSQGIGYCVTQLAYNKLYSSGYGGVLYCYDLTSGDLLWTYGNGGEGNSTNAGLANSYGDYPTFINAVGNDVIYTVTSAHTAETPIYKGALARAINATNGHEIWTLSSYTGEFGAESYAIADGYNTWFNGYDNQIYVVGRGPSQMTISAPSVGVTTSTPIVIKGSATDISAGTKQDQQAADFPNGVPVASDASMKDWMAYVYQQQPEPSNFTGVPVVISVLDSNNNCRVIGTAYTDESGAYSLTWTPDITGNFTVYANFLGTQGYWPSSAETQFYAGNPTATQAPTAAPVSGLASNNTLMYGLIGVILVLIVGLAIIALLIVRKRSAPLP